MTETIPDFTPEGADLVVDLGDGIALHRYSILEDRGEVGDFRTWRIAHTCDRSRRDAGVIRCAPLVLNHVAVHDNGVTVDASILCRDCGLHGHVIDSTWRPA